MCQPMSSSVTCISSSYLSCHLHRYYIITHNSPNHSSLSHIHHLFLTAYLIYLGLHLLSFSLQYLCLIFITFIYVSSPSTSITQMSSLTTLYTCSIKSSLDIMPTPSPRFSAIFTFITASVHNSHIFILSMSYLVLNYVLNVS